MRHWIARTAALGAFFIAALAATAPARAAGGLFEVMFGRQQPAVVHYQYAPVQGLRFDPSPNVPRATRARPRLDALGKVLPSYMKAKARKAAAKKAAHKRRLASLDPSIGLGHAKGLRTPMQKAICCKDGEDPAKAILSDATLRPGDAYMTDKGLRIFAGRASLKAKPAFTDLRRAALDKTHKQRLIAKADMRGRWAAPVRKAAHKAVDVRTGARIDTPARMIVDPNGRTIRAIGPYTTYYGARPDYGVRPDVRAPASTSRI